VASPGETTCLTFVLAVLDLLITHQTNGVQLTALDRQRVNEWATAAPTNRLLRR
jgi:hypothetical protein